MMAAVTIFSDFGDPKNKGELSGITSLLGSKITADGDYSHEIKRHLLLGRKVMTNLDSIFKSRHYFAD